MESNYLTVIVGTTMADRRAFLIAPRFLDLTENDEIQGADGCFYRIMFHKSYTVDNEPLYQALEAALGKPVKVVLRRTSTTVDWSEWNG